MPAKAEWAVVPERGPEVPAVVDPAVAVAAVLEEVAGAADNRHRPQKVQVFERLLELYAFLAPCYLLKKRWDGHIDSIGYREVITT